MTTKAKGIAAAVTVAVAAVGAFFSWAGSDDSRGLRSRDIEAARRPPAPAVADVPAPAQADATDTPMRKAEPTPAGTAVPDEIPGSVLVRVVWKRDGSPAADVEVACNQGRGRILGRTNSDGIVVLDELQPGRVSVGGDRGGRVTANIESGRQVEVTLELGPGITILGRVEDSRGEPVSGADVWLSEGTNFVLGHVVAHSGADGSFSIQDVGAFFYDRSGKIGAGTSETTSSRLVGARARGFIPSDLVTLDVSADWKPLRLVLPGRGASLGGRVLDPQGRPVPRATVILHTESRARVNTRDSLSDGGMGRVTLGSIYATTDGLGRFQFSGWCSGQSWLVVRAAAWATFSERIDLPEGAEVDREMRLDAGVTVKGVVSQPDDESAAYVLVQCRSDCLEPIASTYTTDDGAYTLNCVPAGEFEVQAEKGERRVSERLQGRAGETIAWSPVLNGGVQIQGLLLDDSQVPLEGWLIDAIEESQARPVPGTGTDNNGSFVLKSLDPKGVYRLTARGGPIPSTVLEHVRPGTPISIVVSSNREPSGAMKGVIVDSAGNGIGGACVLVTTRSGGTQVTTEGESGRFRLERLTPEPYAVVIRAEGFSELRLEDHELHPNESWDVGTLRLSRK
jgi:hypothetical protein